MSWLNLQAMVSNAFEGVNEFSSALWQDIEACLGRTVKSGGPRIAVFDADGTLWDKDAGEAFFLWQIANCGFQFQSDPWVYYHEWKKRDPHGAYGWLAQISAGVPIATVRSWAETCFASHSPWPVFGSIRRLVERLQQAGFDIYVVTASVKWSVEPAARHLLGIPANRVLGIETEIINNCVSDRVLSPITYRQGKAEALLRATGGIRPAFAAGNTLGDIALLEAAVDFKLMIQSQSAIVPALPGLAAEEKRLREHGRPLGWRLHAFRS